MQEKISKIDLAETEAVITVTPSHSTTVITSNKVSATELLFGLFCDDTAPQAKINGSYV